MKPFLLCILLLNTAACRADIILEYHGRALDSVYAGTSFSTTDRVTGVFVFDDFQPLAGPATIAAKSITLSTTVGGVPGFQFDITDAATDPRVLLNAFDFSPGGLIPTGFSLYVSGNVFGAAGTEELAISEIGDLATIDAFEPSEAGALNFQAGTFSLASTAVPEPRPAVLLSAILAVAMGWGLMRRNRQPYA